MLRGVGSGKMYRSGGTLFCIKTGYLYKEFGLYCLDTQVIYYIFGRSVCLLSRVLKCLILCMYYRVRSKHATVYQKSIVFGQEKHEYF